MMRSVRPRYHQHPKLRGETLADIAENEISRGKSGSPDGEDEAVIDFLQIKKEYEGHVVTPMSKRFRRGKGKEAPTRKNHAYNWVQKDLQRKEKELEDHRKKLQSRQLPTTELYVDKQRQAAYAGISDLATDIAKNKAKNSLSKIMIVAHDMNWMLYYQEGVENYTHGRYKPALHNFSQSISKEPHELPARAYMKLGKPDNALSDANEAYGLYKYNLMVKTTDKRSGEDQAFDMKSKSRYLKELDEFQRTGSRILIGIYQVRAEAYYALYKFEKALINFHRCIDLRPDRKRQFEYGLVMATKAILNSVWDGCFNIQGLEKVIKLEREKFKMKALFLKNPLAKYVRQVQIVSKINADLAVHHHVVQKKTKRDKERVKPNVGASNLERYRLQLQAGPQDAGLGPLGTDYKFLDTLSSEVKSGNIHQQARDALVYLDQRKEFWRHEDPKNFRKRKITATKARESADRKKLLNAQLAEPSDDVIERLSKPKYIVHQEVEEEDEEEEEDRYF